LPGKDLLINHPPNPRALQVPKIITSQLQQKMAFVAIVNPKQATIPNRQSKIWDFRV
jgi:hypothetical protein